MLLRTRSLPLTDELAHLRGLSAFLPVNILHTMGGAVSERHCH